MKQIKITTPEGDTRILPIANKDFYLQQPGYQVEVIETADEPEVMAPTTQQLINKINLLTAECKRLQAENADLRTRLEAAEAALAAATAAKTAKKATKK